MTKEADFLVAELGRRIKKERGGYKKVASRPQPIPPTEQVRRFLAGEERWRLESGQISPTQWVEYEKAMLDLIRQRSK